MNPCKEISAVSVHRQLDGIAEQVTAELQQYQNDGGAEEELEAKSSSASDDSEEMDTSRSEVDQSTKSHDTTAGDGGEVVILSGGLQLPIKVVLDGINTVLYSRLRFSSPSMQQYYNLENSFIDKVQEWDCVI
ncbi:MAG: transglutaminase-like domain-containing protein [Proteobacteria bacterium]|nr:transglutaminase-like domain-containing protein [Pseudomonadota bacterium]